MKLNKYIIKKEIRLLDFLMLGTGKVFVGIAIGLLLSTWLLPYTFPIMIIGIFLLLPALYFIFKEEEEAEEGLKRRLKQK